MTAVTDWAGHYPIAGSGIRLLTCLICRVKIAETLEVEAGRWRRLWSLAWYSAKLEPAEALGHIPVPRALRIFPVIDNIDTCLCLPGNDLINRLGQILLIGMVVDRLALQPLAHISDQFGRPHQA